MRIVSCLCVAFIAVSATMETFEYTEPLNQTKSSYVDTSSIMFKQSGLTWRLSENVVYMPGDIKDHCQDGTNRCVRARYSATPGCLTLSTPLPNVKEIQLFVANYGSDTKGAFQVEASPNPQFSSGVVVIATNQTALGTKGIQKNYPVNIETAMFYRIVMLSTDTYDRLTFDSLNFTPHSEGSGSVKKRIAEWELRKDCTVIDSTTTKYPPTLLGSSGNDR